MSLRFILGRAGTGKTYTCLEEIRRALREAPDGPPLIFLVPEQATFQTEYALTTTPGLGGMMRAQVLSFRRLAYRVLLEAGGSARTHIGETGKRMVLREFLERRKGELKVFHRLAGQPGFADTLASTISELKLYRVSLGLLAQSTENLKNSQTAGILTDKLADLALLYQDLENYLASRYIDPDDYLNLLAERLVDSPTVREAEFWIDGFAGFTPQEYGVLEAILRTAPRVNVALCLDSLDLQKPPAENGLFFITRETMNNLSKLARESGVKIEQPRELDKETPYRFRTCRAIAHIEKYFFSRPAPQWKESPTGVRLVAAANRRAEVEGVAREITRLCREEGYRWREISLVLRDLESYRELITTIFTDHEIPFFIDSKRTVMHHPLVELIRSALEVVNSGWASDPVFRYLKTDLVPVSREQVDRLENYVLAHGIKGSRWTDGQPWTYRRQYTLGENTELSTWEINELVELNETRHRAVQALAEFHKAAGQAANVREITTALFELLNSLKVAERLQEWSKEAEEQGRLETAREHAQVWRGIIDLFDQVVEAMGEEAISLENYAVVLDAGLESLRLGLIPPGLDQVLVGSLDRSRNPDIRAAFVLGVSDGVLPARPGREGIFTDAERERLQEAGLILSPGRRRRLFDEQFLVYVALTRAGERLWLSYPLADEEGRAVMPSVVVARVKELLPKIEETFLAVEPACSPEEDLQFVSHPGRTLFYLAARLREAKTGISIPSFWWGVYNWALGEPERRRRLAGIVSGLYQVNQEKPLPAPLSRTLYGRRLKMSVSRVEKFQSCPFAHFLSYGLGLKERAHFKLAAPDLGQFFHAALKMFGDRLEEASLDWGQVTREKCRELAGEIVEELAPQLQNEILLSTARHKYLVRKLRRTVERSALVLAEHARRSVFRPVALEIGFGSEEKLPPLILNLQDNSTLELTGRIDRVDVAVAGCGNAYMRIIDYKSGQAGVDLIDIYHGLKLQLLAYLDVALTHAPILAGQEAMPAGMLYFCLHNPLLKTTGPMDQEEVEKMILKELKMQGLVLADAGVVRMMDKLLKNGWSDLLPVALNKDDGFHAGAAVLDAQQFDILRHHLRRVLINSAQQILAGEVVIAPYRKKNFCPCQYCPFKPVCQFDLLMEGNSYRLIKEEPEDIIWTKLLAEEGDPDEQMDR